MTTAQLARMEEQQRKRAAEEERSRATQIARKRIARRARHQMRMTLTAHRRHCLTRRIQATRRVRSMSGDGALTEEQAPPPPSKLTFCSLFRRGASVAPEPKYSE